MTRRPWTVVAVGVALLFGLAAWHLANDRLSAEERAIVGRWRFPVSRPKSYTGPIDWLTIQFSADRRFLTTVPAGPDVTGIWSLRNGTVTVDTEPSLLRRTLRPVAGLLRLSPIPSKGTCTVAVTADSIDMTETDGNRRLWTRVPD
jgi:hypothetical protein